MAIEIVDLRIKNGDFPVRKLLVYQGVTIYECESPSGPWGRHFWWGNKTPTFDGMEVDWVDPFMIRLASLPIPDRNLDHTVSPMHTTRVVFSCIHHVEL